jgi:hypothetical protein
MSESSLPEKQMKPKKGLDVVAILAGVVAVGYLGIVGAAYTGQVGYKPPEIPKIYEAPLGKEKPPGQRERMAPGGGRPKKEKKNQAEANPRPG